MIPVLYYGSETAFTSNGLGRLNDCISCVVTEERNGIYECEFEYPVTGIHFDEIQIDRIILCTHDESGDKQPFIIYAKSEPINGVVTFNAHHVSYRLNHSVVKPFTAANAALAIQAIPNNLLTDCDFTFWTDMTTSGLLRITAPRSVRNLLGGEEGSMLSHYHGEYEFDKFTVKLHQARGTDNGVTIRYGKNLKDYKRDYSCEGLYTAIIPYWYNADTDSSVYGDLIVASSAPMVEDVWTDQDGEFITDDNDNVFEFVFPSIIPIAYDFSDSFEEQPSVAELNSAASSFLSRNRPYLPNENYTINFVQMWQTEEYASYAPLQAVKLCDTVTIVYPDLGVNEKTKVIRTVYNCLLDRYDEIELGSPSKTYFQILLESNAADVTAKINKSEVRTFIARDQAIASATSQLTGQNGDSHIVFTLNADGGMEEMYIMDTNNPDTAVNVWRYNASGWGHSSTGKSGPYTLAATQQGSILADFITTGRLQGYSDNNYWDLTSGYLCAENGKIGDFTINGTYHYLEYFALSMYPYYAYVRISPNLIWYGYEYWSHDGSGNPTQKESGDYYGLDDEGFFIQEYNRLWTTQWITTFRLTNQDPDYRSYTFRFYGRGENDVLGYVYSENKVYSRVNWLIESNFQVQSGYTKSKKVDTADYSNRLLYCYETASPMYGDIGEGQIGEDGRCYIWLDPIFAETIKTDQYQVFLQAYGDGKAYVSERHPGYFVVEGTEGLAFGWELKAKQIDLESVRLANDTLDYMVEQDNYGEGAQQHIDEIKRERGLIR